MKYRNVARMHVLSLAAFVALFSGACGNSPAEKAVATTTAPSILDQAPQFNATIEKVAPIPVPTEQASSQGNQKYHDIIVRPPEKELSSEAKDTLATLLYIQAILEEDEAGLLEAAGLLQQVKAPANVWMDGGVWLMSRKSPNAVPFLELAMKALPDDTSLNLLYGEALGDHGMPGRGAEAMREFLKKHPGNLDVQLELALLLVKDKKFAEAQKILDSIPANQHNILVDYYHAKALVGMDKRAEAIPYLRKAVKGMPDFVEALAELAFLYEQEGDWKEARATYEKLKKLHFSPQEVSLRLVNISLRMKQPEKALQYIKQGPDTVPFKLAAANMLLDAHHYLQAEGILKQLSNRPDAPPEVYLMLADLAFEQRRDLNLAFSWLDKIAANSKAAPRAQLLKIQLLAEAGKSADGLEAARQGQKSYPENPEFCDFEIRLLAREKKTAEALAAARKAEEKWPANPDLAFLLGSLLDEAGDKKEALAVMEKLLEKQPDNFQAMNYVGYSLAEENRDLDRALKLLQKADELSPNQAYIIDSLAWALFRAGQAEKALEKIRRAVSLSDNTDAAIWEHYGDIASRLGHKEEARKAYKKAIALKPDNVQALKQRLSQL